jgi:hypothetical protein
MGKLGWSKKRVILAIAIIAILTGSSFGFWQMNNNAQAAVIDPQPGLVGWWQFDEGSGLTAGDSSGKGNNGTVYNATWVAGKYEQALSFDGASSNVVVANSDSLKFGTGNLSFSAWVKPSVKTNGASWEQNTFLDIGGYSVFLSVFRGCNGIRVYLSDGTNSADHTTNVAISQGTWSNVVVVVDRSANMAYLYLNGSLVDSWSISAITGNLGAYTSNLFIGSSHITKEYFNGIIDECRLYNRTLSAAEIQANFDGGPDLASQLTAKIPTGTTQVIATLSWQGEGSIDATITSPSQTYTEDTMQTYQKTTYSTTTGTSDMLNIKRLSISVTALEADESWTIELAFDSVAAYEISVEVQK